MKIFLVVSIIALVISIIYILLQKSKVNKLVEENKLLQSNVDSAITDGKKGKKYIADELEKANKNNDILARKFYFCLVTLFNFQRNWKSTLNFYTPEANKPTLLLKYNESLETYELFKIGTKVPLNLESDFKLNDKRLSKIIEEFKTEDSNSTLKENGGFVSNVSDNVNALTC